MEALPTLAGNRITLRPFKLGDAKRVQQLAGDYAIARTTLNMPHPYEDGLAEAWIGSLADAFAKKTLANFAVTLNSTGELVGSIGLYLTLKHQHGEAGYWIGKPHWGNGYATEALVLLLDFGFNAMNLNRVFARVFSTNPASEKVLTNNGFSYEGTFPEHVLKDEKFIDLKQFGLLRSDYIKL